MKELNEDKHKTRKKILDMGFARVMEDEMKQKLIKFVKLPLYPLDTGLHLSCVNHSQLNFFLVI
jgi:hypothetical protein